MFKTISISKKIAFPIVISGFLGLFAASSAYADRPLGDEYTRLVTDYYNAWVADVNAEDAYSGALSTADSCTNAASCDDAELALYNASEALWAADDAYDNAEYALDMYDGD